ncbi:MAG: hypothetical protein RR449_01475 [Christensenella sp.]
MSEKDLAQNFKDSHSIFEMPVLACVPRSFNDKKTGKQVNMFSHYILDCEGVPFEVWSFNEYPLGSMIPLKLRVDRKRVVFDGKTTYISVVKIKCAG